MQERTRYTIDVTHPAREALSEMAKFYRITQGEVIEVLMERASLDNGLGAALVAKREAKVLARNPKKAILDRLKNLSADQLAELERSVA